MKKYKFYIIATPIGNLDEVSKRTISALENTATFFSENTKMTKKLLQHLNIDYSNKKFIITNNYRDNIPLEMIKNAIGNGNCALVSDSGYPMISDPGFGLWKSFEKLKVRPEIINGSSAILHALVLSGFSTRNFYFQGFLDNQQSSKNEQLLKLKKIDGTIVIFEGVNKILKTLDSIQIVFGDIEICVVKELTKLNETKYKGKISEIKNQIDLRGEFVILFENINSYEVSENQLDNEIKKLIKSGTRSKDACKIVAYKYNLKANALFKKYGQE